LTFLSKDLEKTVGWFFLHIVLKKE
jgi:hypothetical protein